MYKDIVLRHLPTPLVMYLTPEVIVFTSSGYVLRYIYPVPKVHPIVMCK